MRNVGTDVIIKFTGDRIHSYRYISLRLVSQTYHLYHLLQTYHCGPYKLDMGRHYELDKQIKQECLVNRRTTPRRRPDHRHWSDSQQQSCHTSLTPRQPRSTYTPSLIRFLIVLRSIGLLMIFLYVGNCLVLTGSRKGHASSWASSSASTVRHMAISLASCVKHTQSQIHTSLPLKYTRNYHRVRYTRHYHPESDTHESTVQHVMAISLASCVNTHPDSDTYVITRDRYTCDYHLSQIHTSLPLSQIHTPITH